MLDVIEGKDPAAERKAERRPTASPIWRRSMSSCTPRSTTRGGGRPSASSPAICCPRWGKLKASAISRADVQAMMLRIEAPIIANQTLAAASAIFSWAVRQEILTVNPCHGVDRNPTSGARARAFRRRGPLAVAELDPQLRLILLTGQRPGEVANMQREHIADGWWRMPGKPQGTWPGTKNGRDHRVWLSESALALVDAKRVHNDEAAPHCAS